MVTIENTKDPALPVNFSYTSGLRAEYTLRWEQKKRKAKIYNFAFLGHFYLKTLL